MGTKINFLKLEETPEASAVEGSCHGNVSSVRSA